MHSSRNWLRGSLFCSWKVFRVSAISLKCLRVIGVLHLVSAPFCKVDQSSFYFRRVAWFGACLLVFQRGTLFSNPILEHLNRPPPGGQLHRGVMAEIDVLTSGMAHQRAPDISHNAGFHQSRVECASECLEE